MWGTCGPTAPWLASPVPQSKTAPLLAPCGPGCPLGGPISGPKMTVKTLGGCEQGGVCVGGGGGVAHRESSRAGVGS